MAEEKSFNERMIKVGSHDARMRWGRHRLGINDSDQGLTVDHDPITEVLPPVEITVPLYFAGKVYLNSGTTDHIGHKNLENYYVKQIANSRWALDHIYGSGGSKFSLKPANFSEPRYKTFGVQGNKKQLNIFNVEWRTEGDYDVERGMPAKSARRFGSTEARVLPTDKAIELLSGGYDLWGDFANTPNVIWINGAPHLPGVRHVDVAKFKDDAKEILHIPYDKNSLLSNPNLLKTDSVVTALADSYLSILDGKHVIMPRHEGMKMENMLQFAQALSQMLAARNNQIIGWVTDRGILGYSESKAHHLTFTDENKPSYLQSDDIFVDPKTAIITNRNAKLVDTIRSLFVQPLHQALAAFKTTSSF